MTILTERQSWRRETNSPARIRLKLTTAEHENVRNALVYFCGRFASVAEAIGALGITLDMLAKARSGKRRTSYAMACAVARAADVPVEKVLSGLWPGDRCPHCGGTGRRSQVVK